MGDANRSVDRRAIGNADGYYDDDAADRRREAIDEGDEDAMAARSNHGC